MTEPVSELQQAEDSQEHQVRVFLRPDDAQALYDLTGTLPWNPDAWTHRVRTALSEALHECHTRAPEVYVGPANEEEFWLTAELGDKIPRFEVRPARLKEAGTARVEVVPD